MSASVEAPRRIDFRSPVPGDAALAEAIGHLRADRPVAYPTETTYGFGGRCTPDAIERVAALKGRDRNQPLLILVRSEEEVSGLAWSDEARELSRIFWPGAVTLILPDPEGRFPLGVRSPEGAVAVRVSPHPSVTVLLEALDEPMTSTSANARGGVPARSGEEAAKLASTMGSAGDLLVLDGGVLPLSAPSTLVDCTGAEPVVIREGSVPLGRLRCAIPEIHGR